MQTATLPRLGLSAILVIGLACSALLPATAARAQEPRLQGILDGRTDLLNPAAPPQLGVSAKLVAEKLAAGETATLLVTVTLPDGYYIYSTNPNFGGATKIAIDKDPGGAELSTGFEPLDDKFRADRKPKVDFERLLDTDVEKFYGEVTWFRRYRIAEGADVSKLSLSGSLSGQYCSSGAAGQCIPVRPARKFTAALAEGKPPEFTFEQARKPAVPPFSFDERPAQSNKPMPAVVFARLAPENAKPGETVTLEVGLRLDEGWHTYSLTQKEGQAAIPTSLRVAFERLKPLDDRFAPRPAPEIKQVSLGDETVVQEVHHDMVVWTRKFELLPGGEAKSDGTDYGVAGKLRFAVCRESCLPPKTIEFTLGQVSPETVAAVDPPEEPSAATVVAERGTDPERQGLIPFLVAAVLAGFAALLTPCVFPMVPITVSIFLKESEKEHHRPFWMASIYCAGIIVAFTVLGLLMAALFGATKINEFANNPWLNLGIAAVLVFFGLNLLGMFELRVPGWLLTWTSGKKGQGGVVGVLFMALTFTLVSFTCTFAFAGMLLVWAAKGEYYWPIVGMAAFSAAFSLPFFFLALFPTLLQKLPKSGGWMNTVKVTMGMIEVGAAIKFLSVADLALNPVPVVFDYALVMIAWITIAACTGIYLLGLFRMSHDTPVESLGATRLALAILFLGFGGYMSVGVFGVHKPTGKLWEQIAAFAPPVFEGGQNEMGPYLEHDGMRFALDYRQAVDFAQRNDEPLFLDFTGVNCVNCRLMEDRMRRPHNRDRLQNFVRVQLYTDNVPHISDRSLVVTLLENNRRLQVDLVKDATLPLYAVVTPDGKQVLATFKGLEGRDGEFADFLDRGRQEWDRVAGRTTVGPRLAQELGAERVTSGATTPRTLAGGGSGD